MSINTGAPDDQPAPFERDSRERLRASVDALDGQVLSRLNQARHAALAELGTNGGARAFRIPGIWLPAGVLAAAAVLAVAVWIARPISQPQAQLAEASPVEDAEILASSDNPDLYAEDSDFYEWAGASADAANGEAG